MEFTTEQKTKLINAFNDICPYDTDCHISSFDELEEKVKEYIDNIGYEGKTFEELDFEDFATICEL